MTAPASLQNFSGLRAVVVSRETDPSQPLALALNRLGMDCVFLGPEPTMPKDLAPDTDLLILEGDLHLRGMIQSAEGDSPPDVPVIGLLGVEAPGRLRALMALGATAFIRLPVYAPAVYSAVFLAINTHRHRRQLTAEITAHERRRRGRRHVMKATLALMRQDGIDDDAAYEALRRAAMRSRQSIEDYCQAWLESTDGAPDAAALPRGQSRF